MKTFASSKRRPERFPAFWFRITAFAIEGESTVRMSESSSLIGFRMRIARSASLPSG